MGLDSAYLGGGGGLAVPGGLRCSQPVWPEALNENHSSPYSLKHPG